MLLRKCDLRGLLLDDSFATGESMEGFGAAFVFGTTFVSIRGALDVEAFGSGAIDFGLFAGIANPNGLVERATGAAGQEKDGLAFGKVGTELVGGTADLNAAGTKEGAVTERCCFVGRTESFGEI